MLSAFDEQDSRGIRVASEPDHWRGTEPLRVLAPDGTAVGDTDVGLDPDELRSMLRWMLLARRLDRECIALQRQGELTVYPGFEGQEAAQIGSAMALGPDDFVFPTFRELAAALVRGVDPVRYLWYHRGTWHGGPVRPARDPVRADLHPDRDPDRARRRLRAGLGARRHAGVLARLLRRRQRERGRLPRGGEPRGRVHGPGVLFCQNNGWAISVPTARQTAGEIWRRAEGYGFPGVRVDGNDVLAVYRATREAAARAYAGEGPTLIEALTYRIGAHSTADDAGRYRDDDEVSAARAFDPIVRFRSWLGGQGHVDDGLLADWDVEIEAEVLAIRDGVIAQPAPPVEWMFDWAYADPPAALEEQRREVLGG